MPPPTNASRLQLPSDLGNIGNGQVSASAEQQQQIAALRSQNKNIAEFLSRQKAILDNLKEKNEEKQKVE